MIYFNRSHPADIKPGDISNFISSNIYIYKNYIANRPPVNDKFYPNQEDNGYEAIATGLSGTHHFPGNSMIVGNFFENIQGENEIISNKSTGNIISYNTFRNSYGSVTTRHGGHTTISHNFILGDGYPLSGGIRVVDSNHIIENNYIEGVRFIDSRLHGGIVLMNSDNAGQGERGYQHISNTNIVHNTIVDSVNSLNFSAGIYDLQATNITFANNLVANPINTVFHDDNYNVPNNSQILGNVVADTHTSERYFPKINLTGFKSIPLQLKRHYEDSLFRPGLQSELLQTEICCLSPFDNMDGQLRGHRTYVGADDLSKLDRYSKLLAYNDVGLLSYRLDKPLGFFKLSGIKNSDFQKV